MSVLYEGFFDWLKKYKKSKPNLSNKEKKFMKDPKFKNIRPTEATNEAEIPEPEFQIMKKSLLRAKWYLENEEMDTEMVSSELRDVNAMLNAVEDGISDMSKVGLDTSVDEQYMSLYREAIAKLKGEKTSIYGVDNDVLPPDAKPNPKSAYNSGSILKI